MDDLALLGLLEKAQAKQRGPKGATGIGIREINQTNELSFTVVLDDGTTKEINIPAPIKGDTGTNGASGPKGDQGPAGTPGRNGADALPGSPGRDGAPGVSVDTAVVNSDAHLLLRLTDGSFIDCGRVVGPAGATGASGPAGLPGSAGVDGAAVLSGPRTPQSDDGKDGDHWIDLSSATFGFYKKASGAWTKLGELRVSQLGRSAQQGAAVGGGAGGSGGSGGGTAQTSATLPLANPTRGGKASKALPDVNGLKTQADYNSWIYSTLETLESSGGGGDYLPLTGGTLTGKVVFKKERENVNSISLSILGRIKDNNNALINDVLLKSYQREESSASPDYIAYYGQGGGSNEILNRKTAQAEFASKTQVEAGETIQEQILDRVQAGEVEQNRLKLDVEELSITKGSVARYKIQATNIGAAGRNGELYVNNAVAADVQAMSFAPFDLNGQPIKPCNAGDIIELVQAVALMDVGEVSRYRIVSGESNALTVEYLSGTNDFEVDETQEVYIYPQNAAGASKDYVDAQNQLLDDKKLNLTGGTLTNSLTFNRGNKASAQFGIEPNSGTSDTNIYVFNDGQMRLRSSHTSSIDDRVGSHIVLDPNGGVPETKIYNVVTPTNDTMAVSKAYLDQAISEALADLIGSDGGSDSTTPILRPAMLSWKYEGSTGTTATTPGSGNFNLHEAGSGNKYLRFSFNSNNGCAIGDGKFDDTTITTGNGPMGTIWEWMDGSVAKFKLKRVFRIAHLRWNYQLSSNESRHFEFKLDSSDGHEWSTFTTNRVYYIAAGGFF